MLGFVALTVYFKPVDLCVTAGDVVGVENLGADDGHASWYVVGVVLERGREVRGANSVTVDYELNFLFTGLAEGSEGNQFAARC